MRITGNQVRGFRLERGLPRAKLANMLSVSEVTIFHWEQKQDMPIPNLGVDRFRGWYKAQKEGVPYNPPRLQHGKRGAGLVKYTKPEIALEDVLDAAE